MRVAFYCIHAFEKPHLERINGGQNELVYIPSLLSESTAHLSEGCEAVSLFSSDSANAEVLEILHAQGVKFIALRSAGYDHVDLKRARELNIRVANVPAYSPNSIAEHAVAMILALNRKLIEANLRVTKYDFRLDGLTGFDLNHKTVGVVGTGKIGGVFARILHGFGCKLLGYDLDKDQTLIERFGMEYMSLDQLCIESDIISIHVPLNPQTKYLINEKNIAKMKPGVMLVNTARGGVLDTDAVMNALVSGRIGFFGMDVYEHEKGIFFFDHSDGKLQDERLKSLIAMDNVLITSHQAFLTNEALEGIATTTISNINAWQQEGESANELH